MAQYVIEKILNEGGKPITASDSSGYIYEHEGIDKAKLKFIQDLKIKRRGRINEYAEAHPSATFIPRDPDIDYNPLWDHKANCAFPFATQNEINTRNAQNMVNNGINLVAEGANMP